MHKKVYVYTGDSHMHTDFTTLIYMK